MHEYTLHSMLNMCTECVMAGPWKVCMWRGLDRIDCLEMEMGSLELHKHSRSHHGNWEFYQSFVSSSLGIYQKFLEVG